MACALRTREALRTIRHLLRRCAADIDSVGCAVSRPFGLVTGTHAIECVDMTVHGHPLT
jgi:hypothetical protein